MDKRLHSRVAVESQCKARFRLAGQTYNDITVANLGADGCCIQMPAKSAEGITNRATLDGLELIHPGLPKGTIKAKVVWSQGRDRARADYVETGVQFTEVPTGYTRDLDRYLNTLGKSNPSTYM